MFMHLERLISSQSSTDRWMEEPLRDCSSNCFCSSFRWLLLLGIESRQRTDIAFQYLEITIIWLSHACHDLLLHESRHLLLVHEHLHANHSRR